LVIEAIINSSERDNNDNVMDDVAKVDSFRHVTSCALWNCQVRKYLNY